MASVPKTDALETLLTGISESKSVEYTPRSADEHGVLADRVIILTILSKQTQAMPREELMIRSELPADQFERTIAHLVEVHLVETDNIGFQLTDAGREAAEWERQRLLRLP